jgi:putative colanic acid biosynthesis UDP-glucose lipid carrier transferase
VNYFTPHLRNPLVDQLVDAGLWPGRKPAPQPGIIQQYGGTLVRLGIVVDSAIVFAALWRVVTALGDWNDHFVILGLTGVCLFVLTATSSNLYRSWRLVRLRRELGQIAILWTVSFALTGTIALLMAEHAHSTAQRLMLLLWYVAALAGLAGVRIGVRMSLRYYRAYGHDQRRVAFVGFTDVSRRLAEFFHAHPWMGVEVVGFYGDAAAGDGPPGEERILGGVEDLVRTDRDEGLSAVYIALPMSEQSRIQTIIDRFSDTTTAIYYCPPLFGLDPVNAHWGDINGHPVISIVESPFSGVDQHLKRAEDLVLSCLILPLIVLPMLAIAAAVKLTSPGPVLYRQTRYGLDGRGFNMLKFRTMYCVETDDQFVQAVRNDPRVTPLGAFLRRTSLDELPQLFNVLAGDMSLVGPRPHPVKLNEAHRKQIRRYMLRHIVKPGITGWAQVNGCRGETQTLEAMRQRIDYDLYYIKRWSIGLDARILLKTLLVGFSSPRAY